MARKKKPGSGDEGSGNEDGVKIPEEAELTAADNVVPFKKREGGEEEEKERARQNDRLERLNAQYCVVKEGSRVWVLEFQDRELNGMIRLVPVYMKFSDFENFHRNKKIIRAAKKGGGTVETPEGTWWLDHPRRREYVAVVFDPTKPKEFDKKLNLWRGFGVPDEEGDWSLMRRHIEEVICSGEEEHADYLIKWLAWAVQHPGLPAEVALVMRGRKGVGKGVLANSMLAIFGQHGFAASSAEQIAGKFNAHLRDTSLVFADEAFWPGDHRMEDKLKQMLTEPVIPLEGKGRDVIAAKNCLKMIMASESNWVIPAGEGERRFMMVEVSDKFMQDDSYFNLLIRQMKNGGYSAMLHDLLATDLGDWHPRRVVRTKALLGQQMLSMDVYDKWMVDIATNGVIPGHDPEDPSFAYSGPHNHLLDWEGFDSARERPGLDQALEGMLRKHRTATIYDAKEKLKKDYGVMGERPFIRSLGRQLRGWRFPPLAEVRAKLSKRFNGLTFDETIDEWATDLGKRGHAKGTE